MELVGLSAGVCEVGGGYEGNGSESDGHRLHHVGPFCAGL